MNLEDEVVKIQRSLGRIEGRLEALPNLVERVSRLEHWHTWLKALWTALAAAFAYMFRGIHAR